MDSNLLDLNLSLNPTYVSKPIATLLNDISQIHDSSVKKLVLNDSIRRYEEELSKVKLFINELPQCNLLLMDAIEFLKYEIMSHVEMGDCDFDKFGRPSIKDLPSKGNNFGDELGKETAVYPPHTRLGGNPLIRSSSSSENFRIPNLNTIELDNNYMSDNGPYMAFEAVDHKHVPVLEPEPEPDQLVESNNSRVPKRSSGNYKERRAWTPELHTLFVQALGRLGGPQVATPKRISEIMRVDGLTVEQVKSHLQKYRLHFKRLPPPDVHPALREATTQDPWAPAIYYSHLMDSAAAATHAGPATAGGGRVAHN